MFVYIQIHIHDQTYVALESMQLWRVCSPCQCEMVSDGYTVKAEEESFLVLRQGLSCSVALAGLQQHDHSSPQP